MPHILRISEELMVASFGTYPVEYRRNADGIVHILFSCGLECIDPQAGQSSNGSLRAAAWRAIGYNTPEWRFNQRLGDRATDVTRFTFVRFVLEDGGVHITEFEKDGVRYRLPEESPHSAIVS